MNKNFKKLQQLIIMLICICSFFTSCTSDDMGNDPNNSNGKSIPRIKNAIISCTEVNDTNPLNNLCFTLKNSKRPLVNIVVLFAGNINYNSSTQKVYIQNNPNVQHLLNNKEKYIKPLQDKGIKVVLGILGNHDKAGVADLSNKTAKGFAQQLKDLCVKDKLDGVFFDDEYSDYEYGNTNPIFVDPSSEAASRLCYETKKAMPNKLVCVYVLGYMDGLCSIEGQQPGSFIDYALEDYNRSSSLDRDFPGLPKNGWGLYSQEFNLGYIASSQDFIDAHNNGYANMIFSMDPNRDNFNNEQLPTMQQMANILFKDQLIYNGKPYRKDW